MPEAKIHTWTVRGRGLFPFDMLRYDSCWPHSERDSAKIEATTRRSAANEIFTINMYSLTPKPTIGRWKSFGWEVL